MEETPVVESKSKAKRVKAIMDLQEEIGKPRICIDEKMSKIESLIEQGVPLLFAVFHKTVRSISTEPEMAFFDASHLPRPKPSKEAKLWYTPHGVVVEQTMRVGKDTRHHFKIIPLANVADTIVK